jgi:hypothetical protein
LQLNLKWGFVHFYYTCFVKEHGNLERVRIEEFNKLDYSCDLHKCFATVNLLIGLIYSFECNIFLMNIIWFTFNCVEYWKLETCLLEISIENLGQVVL